MLPLYFGPPDHIHFGIYHAPLEQAAEGRRLGRRRAAVLLVDPFGHEQAHAHRTLRHLAERLAALGFAVLRFDLDGVGDSCGDDRAGGRVDAWKQSVRHAAAALRERSGAEALVLAGLRGGALLSTIVAGKLRADHLVLWMPVTSGKAYAREQLRLHKMLFPKAKSVSTAPEDEEALGFPLRKDTVADLAKLDVSALAERPANGCLVIGGGDSPAEDKLLDKLSSLGVETVYKHLPGHPFLVTDPHRSAVPDEVIDAIAQHLTERYPSEDGGGGAGAEASRPAVVLGGPHREEAWTFGVRSLKFGVLTRPKESTGKPAIILMNAGSIHHVGPNRQFVRMARRWADLGYPVLRMDLSGIGESPAAEGTPESLPYPRDAVLDAKAAMTALESGGVARRFVLTGLCSGADIAFRAALIDERAIGAWMINPQAFHFPSSDALKEFMHAELEASYYQGAMWDIDRWKKVLRGQVDLGRIAGIMRDKAEGMVKRGITRLIERVSTSPPDSGRSKDVIADLRSIAARTSDAFLLCSDDDPGLIYLMQYFGSGLDDLDRTPGFRREVIKGVDHTFTPLWSQDVLSDMLTEHLLKTHP